LAVEPAHPPHQRLVVVQSSQKIGRRGSAHYRVEISAK
jgi:hypothetical protein